MEPWETAHQETAIKMKKTAHLHGQSFNVMAEMQSKSNVIVLNTFSGIFPDWVIGIYSFKMTLLGCFLCLVIRGSDGSATLL